MCSKTSPKTQGMQSCVKNAGSKDKQTLVSDEEVYIVNSFTAKNFIFMGGFKLVGPPYT